MADPEKVDVNDAVREKWKENTSTFERVRTVIKTTYDGMTASEIADKALVAEGTARGHLEELADSGYVKKTSDPNRGATLYQRSMESLILENAHDILENADTGTILNRVNDMQAEINEYRDRTGVEEPEDIAWDNADLDREELRSWQTTRRNLGFAKVALALDQAEDVVNKRTAV
ncbi:winged helix-turn-helix domain-containing protein [Natrinema amylolyticum]|uniref:winged helix-turn-helix domain-containing protein n=1 Tax=Natrinema amylolyticum TaxID=2878679 RepID=UPI001CFA11A3|nr:winged helix-turn-helix domain-containing protein [Natrinema amylolyticum]